MLSTESFIWEADIVYSKERELKLETRVLTCFNKIGTDSVEMSCKTEKRGRKSACKSKRVEDSKKWKREYELIGIATSL